METEQLTGTVTLVQERRFRLLDEAGRSHLVILAHDAAVEPELLRRMITGPRITVTGRRVPGLIALVASHLFAKDAETEGSIR